MLLCIATWLCPPLTTFMSSIVHMSQLAPLSVLRAPLLTSVCSLVNLCVLPCWPLCAPLLTSVCSLVDLCVLPCGPLCAPLLTSMCFLLDLCVLPCRPLCAPLWTSVCSLVCLCELLPSLLSSACSDAIQICCVWCWWVYVPVCYVRVGALLCLCLVLCLCLIMCLCIVCHASCIHTLSRSKYLQLWRNGDFHKCVHNTAVLCVMVPQNPCRMHPIKAPIIVQLELCHQDVVAHYVGFCPPRITWRKYSASVNAGWMYSVHNLYSISFSTHVHWDFLKAQMNEVQRFTLHFICTVGPAATWSSTCSLWDLL